MKTCWRQRLHYLTSSALGHFRLDRDRFGNRWSTSTPPSLSGWRHCSAMKAQSYEGTFPERFRETNWAREGFRHLTNFVGNGLHFSSVGKLFSQISQPMRSTNPFAELQAQASDLKLGDPTCCFTF